MSDNKDLLTYLRAKSNTVTARAMDEAVANAL